MFSPLAPADMLTAIGRATRAAARNTEPASDFSRGQLMSAFSVSRHLAVEVERFPPELRSFADRVAGVLRDAPVAGQEADLARTADALGQATEAAPIGDLVAGVLDVLRDDASPAAIALRARIHAELRAICDREVTLLADVIEAPRA